MVQQVEHEGVIHNFPDEATPEMMSQALGLNTPKEEKPLSLKEKMINMLPKIPSGINIASGAISTGFPSNQSEFIKNIPQVLSGTQPSSTQKAEQIAGELLPGMENPIGAITSIPSIIKSSPQKIGELISKSNPKNLFRNIQKGHDFLEQRAKDIYNFVKNESVPRGIGKLDLDKKLFDEIKELPIAKDSLFKDLIERAEKGDYEALRDLQSEIGTYSFGLKSSPLPSERYMSRSVKNLRDKFNEDMYKKMEERGADDLANLLKEANKHYTDLHEIYYQVPKIRNLVSKGRILPSSPTSLKEESERIEPLLKAHPEIKKLMPLINGRNIIKKGLMASVPFDLFMLYNELKK